MINGLTLLFLMQLLGEGLVFWLHLPLPGPLLGMLILAGWLVWRGTVPEGLRQASGGLLQHLMLLFITLAGWPMSGCRFWRRASVALR